MSLALALWGCAALGLCAYLAQVLLLARFRRGRAPPAGLEPVSVLKPLCGLDDELELNLASFLAQRHPRYELLLGCRSERDPAWPLARELARRHPGRVRAVLQRGGAGLNPKVNQLATLAEEARFGILVISDSNVRVGPDYLSGIAGHLADPEVGLVTHPVAGAGGRALGSRLDNLHLSGGVSVGVVGAKAGLGQDIVVGKSMALRRADLAALGGLASVRDVLAEDFVLGRRVGAELGKRVVLANEPVLNVTRDAPVASFLARYARWSVMQRKTAGTALYLAQGLLTPVAWAALALAASPGLAGAACLAGVVVARAALEVGALRLLGGAGTWREARLVPLKEALVFGCWLKGLVTDTINWRGTQLRVRAGSRLERAGPAGAAPEYGEARSRA